MERYDLIVREGTIVGLDGIAQTDIGIREGRIAAIGALGAAHGDETFLARGLHIMPGVIDSQVHFREPGNMHKEDLETGTRAAVLGGVTSVFEMPNTEPPTTTAEELAAKRARAKGRVYCDIAFYVGATPDNARDLRGLESNPGCAGVKVFLGKSTGNLLVAEDADLAAVLSSGNRRVAFHCEDNRRLDEREPIARQAAHPRAHPEWRDVETALRATRRVLKMARRLGRRVHILHTTTAEELDLLQSYRDLATIEVTPQHLTLVAPECYETQGTFVQMNPPIRDARHREALWAAVRNGLVDVIGSDHAPHTREEKEQPYPDSPSGMPGVQTLLPLMLDHVAKGHLSLQRMVDLCSSGPARVFGAARKGRIALGYDADLTAIDLGATRKIENSWIASRCGWTPFDGMTVTGWPKATLLRGRIVMRDDQVMGPPSGEIVRFQEAL